MSTINDPYPTYHELLEHHPVSWHDQMGCWVVVRYADCREVLRNHEVYARDWRRVGDEIPEFKQSVQSQDPPDQGVLRSFLMNRIKEQDLVDICRRGCSRVARRLDALRGTGPFDLQTEIAAPYGLFVTAELLGIDEPDLAEFAAVSDAIARRMDAGLDPSTAGPGDLARQRLYELVDSWFAANLRPGLLSALKTELPNVECPEYLVRNTVGILFNAGYSTTFATTGNATLTLLSHPGALEQVADPSRLVTAVEELVRFDGPAQGTTRVATTEAELSGVPISAGDEVLTLFAAANRDPRQFTTPDELILDRSPNRHLGFGWGAHSCLGAMLGQEALRAYVHCLSSYRSSLRLAGEPRRRRTATLRCLETLPVEL